LSADDLDAYWEGANLAGEETAGGTTPTPDQDQADEYGKAWGIDYERTEALDITRKKRLDSESRDWQQEELKEKKRMGKEDEKSVKS
jgi:hypothetical protein